MARYQLPKAQSMYRDTGLVANTQLFRQRYVQNMAADDALAQSVLEMSSMEEDQEAKAALVEKYNAQLKQRSESDNYHMLGSAIQKDARSFINEYQPLKVSKERYDNWADNLRKQYESGFVDSETYNLKMSEARYNYKGVQKKADGSTDESSLFVGPSYVQDVDVLDLIDTNMKDLVMQELEKEGEIPVNSNMTEFDFGTADNPATGSPAYYIKKGSYVKWMDAGKVQAIATKVLNESNVKAAINQKAHLQNFTKGEMTDENISVATKELDATIFGLESAIDKLEAKKKRTKAEDVELEDSLALLELIEGQRDKGVDELSIRTSLAANTMRGDYIDYAVMKYAGVKSEKYTSDMIEGSRYTQGLKIQSENPTGLAFMDGFTEAEALGGTTTTSLDAAIVDSEAAYNAEAEGYEPEILTQALKYDGSTAKLEQFASDYNLDETAAFNKIKEIKALYRAKDVRRLRKEQLYTSLGTTEEEYTAEVGEAFKDVKVGNTSVQDLAAAITDLNIIPNPTIFQTLNYMQELESGGNFSEKSAERNSLIDYIIKAKGYTGNDANEKKANMNYEISKLVDKYEAELNTKQIKLNEQLAIPITTDGLIMPSFGDPSGGTKNSFKELLEGTDGTLSLGNNFKLKTDKGQTLTWKELKESGEGIWEDPANKPQIDWGKTGLFAIPTIDGQATMAITFVGEDGNDERYYANVNQFTSQENSVLNNYITGTKFEIEKIYQEGRAGGLIIPYAPIDFKDNNEYLEDGKENPFYGEPTVIFNYSGGATHYENKQGDKIPLTDKAVHVLETTVGDPDYGQYVGYDVAIGLKAIAGFIDKSNIRF